MHVLLFQDTTLDGNHAKTTSQNNELLLLKADVDAIKKALADQV